MSPPPAAAPKAAPDAEFLIGVLARRSGRSVHAIRWYESLGLVPGVDRKLALYAAAAASLSNESKGKRP